MTLGYLEVDKLLCAVLFAICYITAMRHIFNAGKKRIIHTMVFKGVLARCKSDKYGADLLV